MKRVSVVVPAYNAEKTLGSCLGALTSQVGLSAPLEIVVVDDGSTDRTAQLVRSFAGVTLVQQENAGPGAARNAGAAVCHGELVLFTDSDCVPAPGWAAAMLAAFADDAVALVMGRTCTRQDHDWIAKVQQGSDLAGLAQGPATRFNTNNLGIVAEVARALPFDAALRIYGEDTDLGWRVIASGRKALYWPHAEVTHGHPHTLRSFLREGLLQGWGSARLHYKHGKGLPRDLAFGVIAVAALALASVPWLRRPMLLGAAAAFSLFLAALLWNELHYKRKSLSLALWTFPMQLTWYLCKLTGYLHMLARIAVGAEPALVASKREFARTRGASSG